MTASKRVRTSRLSWLIRQTHPESTSAGWTPLTELSQFYFCCSNFFFFWGPPTRLCRRSPGVSTPDSGASAVSLQSVSRYQQKAAASVTASVLPNKNQVLSDASAGRTDSGTALLEILTAIPKPELDTLSLVTLSLRRMFRFSELAASKQPGWKEKRKKTKCRYLLLKTVYFLLFFCFTVTLATYFLSCVTVGKRSWKVGRLRAQRKRLYQFFPEDC